ncbi:MAG: hypothetical protein WAW37_12540 [Syntrophobacteraceae bacterium]
MISRILAVTGMLLLSIFIAGCQTMQSSSQGGVVAPADRAPVAQGRNTGTWQGTDIAVDYKYSLNPPAMDFSGTVRFLSHMTFNFQILHDFRLSVIFTDQDGRVLGTQGLTTNRDGLEPFPVQARLTIPAGTSQMAFSYQGTALSVGDEDGGGGGPTYFWQYPVR